MRFPEFLKPGGSIGLPAPSYGCADDYHRARLLAAISTFEKTGYKVLPGPNAFSEEGIGKSNTPEKCGAELNDFFLHDAADVLISCGGGETMCEDLPFVDFDAIRKAEPKWFMGYSDNTNLTFLLPTLCDIAAVYGQCAPAFGMREWHASLDDDFRILTGKTDAEEKDGAQTCEVPAAGRAAAAEAPTFTFTNYGAWARNRHSEEGEDRQEDAAQGSQETFPEEPAETQTEEPEEDYLAPWELNEPYRMSVFRPGETAPTEEKVQAGGRLLGGCMDCLSVLCGTRFDKVKDFTEKYRDDGILWFLEACDLNPMAIRRSLWQMREAGWFAHAKGFLFGRPLHYEEELFGMNRINAVLGALEGLDVPVFLDIDLGHLPPAIPMITGAAAYVSAENNRLTVRQVLR